jgi:hypothetical protein
MSGSLLIFMRSLFYGLALGCTPISAFVAYRQTAALDTIATRYQLRNGATTGGLFIPRRGLAAQKKPDQYGQAFRRLELLQNAYQIRERSVVARTILLPSLQPKAS